MALYNRWVGNSAMASDNKKHSAHYFAGTRLGLEMEMAVADARTGRSAPVRSYFKALAALKAQRGVPSRPVYTGHRCTALITPDAECGLDNGFNLLETALAPVKGGASGLKRLATIAHRELSDTLHALRHDGLCVINGAQHPACPRDPAFYAQMCVPRPIYRELVEYRGWHHREGIDAKAQNGTNTAVPVHQAARALNALIGLAPAVIAMYANSPLESGRITGLHENRLTLWPRVFSPARFAGDFMLACYPKRPFHDLGDYFRWMFGNGTVSRSLPLAGDKHYKTADTAILDGAPCLHDFLYAHQWPARMLADRQRVVVRPHAGHFVYSQIACFLDARFRYHLQQLPSLSTLLAAWKSEGGLEALFAECGIDAYIEGRAPGANFADAALLDEAGSEVAGSVLVSASALQLGLLCNLDQALDLVHDMGWAALGQLREVAIREGVQNDAVRALCTQVLDVARGGLDRNDQQWLAYPDYVVSTRRCGATRLLETWCQAEDDTLETKLQRVIRRHAALEPIQFIRTPHRPPKECRSVGQSQ